MAPPSVQPIQTQFATWADYTDFVRRHRALLLTCLVVGLGLGLMRVLLTPTTYSASASVVLYSAPAYVTVEARTQPQAVTVDSDAQLVKQQAVLRAVAHAVGGTPAQVKNGLSVTAIPLTEVLLIAYSADKPSQASAGANAAARAFMALRRQTLISRRAAQSGALERQIDVLQRRLGAQNRSNPVFTEADPLLQQLQSLREQLEWLENRALKPAEITNHAIAPAAPTSTDIEVPVVSGVMVGLLVGCLIGATGDLLRQEGAYAAATRNRGTVVLVGFFTLLKRAASKLGGRGYRRVGQGEMK